MKKKMTSLSEAKALGGIGSLMVLLTAVPNIGWVLGIAGFIMILVAINNISQVFNDRKIFNNMLTAVILGIGAIGVGTVTVIGAVYNVLGMGSFVGSHFVLAPHVPVGDWLGLAATVIGGLLAVWAILVASAVFVRRSYSSIGARVNVHMFETAGLLYLIGAATTIIGVGFVILLVAEILLAVSFFSIPDQSKVPAVTQVQTVTATG